MTEALKRMVEAMISEAKRQDAEDAATLERQPWLKDEPVATEHTYDWDRIARAGLVDALGAAFRAGFDAGADFADFREGKYAPSEDPPGEDEAARQYIESIIGQPNA